MASNNSEEIDKSFNDNLDEFIDEMNDKESAGRTTEGGENENLTSFFEDLSDIDNIDDENIDDDPLPAMPPATTPSPIREVEDIADLDFEDPFPEELQAKTEHTKGEKQKNTNKKRRSFPIFGLLITVLIAALGFGGFYLWDIQKESIGDVFADIFSSRVPEPEFQPLDTQEILDLPNPDTLIVEPPGGAPKSNLEVAPAGKRSTGPVLVDKTGVYYVQVAACIYDICRRQARDSLREHDYGSENIVQKNSIIKKNFIQYYVDNELKLEQAVALQQFINANNTLSLKTYITTLGKGVYRVMIGLYPDDKKSREHLVAVEEHIKDILTKFPEGSFFFNSTYLKKSIKQTKILVGPYAKRTVADKALRDIQGAQSLSGAFVTRAER